MNIIVKKIVIVTIAIVILVFSVFASVNTITFSKAFTSAIEDKVVYETEKFSNQFSMIFENAEGAIDALSTEVCHHFDMKKQMESIDYIEDYISDFSPVLKNALIDIEDAQGIYLTFNPEITDKKNAYEIWFSYDDQGKIVYTDATRNGVYQSAFEHKEFPHMRYYFNAIEAKENGVWTGPYTDPDIDKEVIAYSRAVYSDGELIGVIGTDISTEHTTQVIQGLKVDHEGMVLLLDQSNRIVSTTSNVYSNELLQDTEFMEYFTAHMSNEQEGVFSENWKSEEMRISFSELTNEWKLVILNYESKLKEAYYDILMTVILLAVVLIGALLLVVFFVARKVSSPIDKAIEMLRRMDLEHQIGENDTQIIKDEDDILLLVDKAVKRQRTNDMMLSNQSKMATVGEMMANVTHQWKQPLNNINIIIGSLKDDIKFDTLDRESALYSVQRVENLITDMAETLKDFSDYLKPDKELMNFNINRVIHAVLELLADKIKAKNIEVIIVEEENLYSYGFKNSFYHVILNVLNNAIDGIVESGRTDGKLIIEMYSTGTEIELSIFDNGVMMSNVTETNVFVPYYTTKQQGTGLGLSIAKQLIEESMKGSIALKNVVDGVECKIVINRVEDGNE